jgi:chemosensory pili system protein ChpA (sensor histidine kinase/response regulator)
MDDTHSPFHQDELSEEDLEVLRAFHTLEEPASDNPLPRETPMKDSFEHQSDTGQSSTLMSEDDMLVLFATEADEDIATMRSVLQQLEQDDHIDAPCLKALKRSAHKVAGTAAAIGCNSMSTIAHHMEAVIKLVEDGTMVYLTGLIALVHAVRALELTLQSIVVHGYESKNPLLDLEEQYKELAIDVHAAHTSKYSSSEDVEATSARTVSQHMVDADHTPASIRVDVRHLNKLIEHTEKLIELDTPLENAQQQVETALNELHTAQARLRRLEPLLSSLSVSSSTMPNALIADAGYPPSSLVARILQEAVERTGHVQKARSDALTQPLLNQETALWDEMEIDRFSETNVLAHAFTEAITDVATATSQLRQALAHLKSIVAQQVGQASAVRNETFLLQSVPLSILVTRLEQAVETLAGAQKEHIQFEAAGGTIEIERDILEALSAPFLGFVQSSVAECLLFAKRSERGDGQRLRIWLNAHAVGNEVTIEVGLSLTVSPGAIGALQETVHHLHGSVSLHQRAVEETTLLLRLPRSQRIIQGLLARAGSQCVIVPVAQVRRIQYNKQRIDETYSQEAYPQDAPFAETHAIYHLNTLLGFFTGNGSSEQTIRTALVLQLDNSLIAVEVDEVVEEVELVMKPLAAHLCRPGISRTAVDGSGNVLLVVNLPEMIRLKETRQHAGETVIGADTLNNHEVPPAQPSTQLRRKILIADDSVYIRRSINLTLNHEGYDVLEAEDGLHTLEQLSKESPDLLLLDIEMPDLNGYDVLNIIRTHQRFPGLKIVLLTSRSSDKHIRRGRELGAHAYLTKPCPQDLLLETIRSLLGEENLPFNI